MINKKNFIFKTTILAFVLISCFILNSCKGCNKKVDTPDKLEINELTEDVYVGYPIELSFTSTIENCEVLWSIDNTKLAKIEGNTLKPLKVGTVTVTATYIQDESIFDTLTIEIKKYKAESLEISVPKYTIMMGESIDLNATVYPLDVPQDVNWSIRDNKEDWDVAELNGNTLTGIKYGKVYVTGKSPLSYEAQQTVIIEVLHPLLENEDVYEAKYIRGAFGEDASSMYTIQYSTYNSKSYALVTTSDDPEFKNAKEYYGEGYYFEDLGELLIGKFEGRNVWRIEMTDLESDTEYIYKINKGNDTYSDVYTFKTAGENTPTSFLFITDTHYYTGTTGTTASAAVSEEIVKEALNYNPNISFIMDAGDLIDTGGNSKIWDVYFQYANSLKQLPFISVPGNHEYYFNQTGQGDNSYFKIFNPGPDNGPSGLKGSTGWFKHNDTLFIMVDNIRGTAYDEQMEWMADLLENQDYNYSIVMFHIPVNFDNTDYDERFLKLFDKYSVDLVLTGHYHSETLTEYLYDGEKTTDPYLGTCYLTGAYSGIKGASSADNAINTAKGYMIDITDEAINIQIIYANGKLGKSWSITNRRADVEYPFNGDYLMGSIDYKYNEETSELTFFWPKEFYGNTKRIEFSENFRGEINDYVVFPSPSYTSITFDNVQKGLSYLVILKVYFNDGNEIYRDFRFNLFEDFNLDVKKTSDDTLSVSFDPLDESLRYKVSTIQVRVYDELDNLKETMVEFSYLENGEYVTSCEVSGLNFPSKYIVRIDAVDSNGKIIYVSYGIPATLYE